MTALIVCSSQLLIPDRTLDTLSRAGPWAEYDTETCKLLENVATLIDVLLIFQAYKAGQTAVFMGDKDTPIGKMVYYVDFEVMEQKRVDDPFRRRVIKRE
jgi:hypothetical protein